MIFHRLCEKDFVPFTLNGLLAHFLNLLTLKSTLLSPGKRFCFLSWLLLPTECLFLPSVTQHFRGKNCSGENVKTGHTAVYGKERDQVLPPGEGETPYLKTEWKKTTDGGSPARTRWWGKQLQKLCHMWAGKFIGTGSKRALLKWSDCCCGEGRACTPLFSFGALCSLFWSWKFVSSGACETTGWNVEFELVKLQRSKSLLAAFLICPLEIKAVGLFPEKTVHVRVFPVLQWILSEQYMNPGLELCHFSLKQIAVGKIFHLSCHHHVTNSWISVNCSRKTDQGRTLSCSLCWFEIIAISSQHKFAFIHVSIHLFLLSSSSYALKEHIKMKKKKEKEKEKVNARRKSDRFNKQIWTFAGGPPCIWPRALQQLRQRVICGL